MKGAIVKKKKMPMNFFKQISRKILNKLLEKVFSTIPKNSEEILKSLKKTPYELTEGIPIVIFPKKKSRKSN